MKLLKILALCVRPWALATLAMVLALLGAATPATAWPLAGGAPPSNAAALALQAEVDQLVMRGYEHPDEALAALAALARQGEQNQRPALLGSGLVAAASGRQAELKAALASLKGLADGTSPDPLAAADALLLQATLADTQGDTKATAEAAQAALKGYRQICEARTDCDYRATFRALQLMARHDVRRGLSSAALEQALAAAELARNAGDTARQVLALAAAADMSGLQGDSAAEQRYLAQAQRMARLEGSPLLRSRLRLFEAKILRHRGDNEGARQAAASGVALARQAGSDRLAASHLANLADALVATNQPRAALAAVEEALPVVRRHRDQRTERILTHNGALARIALGDTASARRVLDGLLAIYHESGATADEAMALHEFADAFAAAGDLPAALQLFHRERDLAAQMMAANRDAALAELRQRFDREAQQRRLDLLARESRLMSTQLNNRAALQKVWLAGAIVLALAAALVALMYRRVREINRRLEHNHAFLRAQSHLDPLTGLCNRRGLHEAAAARGQDQRYEGALLLVDIDHFKRVNDGHGHAVGDVVLVEVARRLAQVVREGDVVVRWGGEEFLICMPEVDAAQAQALAQRVLQAVGGEPVLLPGPPQGALPAGEGQATLPANEAQPALRVTASIGYGCFPLPPALLPLSLERAINLADMALYTAKNQGRNCAVGISHAAAADTAALQALEADFDQARHEGRVTLDRMAGPALPVVATPTPTAAAAPAHESDRLPA